MMSDQPMLGMYIHQHWGYRNPYSARTWTLADWRGYAEGLTALGYNSIMLWPMLETLPDPLTASDRAHLEKIRTVIDMLHRDFGMTVLITLGANVIGNDEAARHTFEERPYFCCDRRLNPADAEEMAPLYRIRRALFSEYFHAADGFVMIDSDPGGYVGSTNEEFVEIFQRHLALLQECNPQAYLYYWMWMGWETYNCFWEDTLAGKTKYNWSTMAADCEEAVREIVGDSDARWRLFCCMDDIHKPIMHNYGVQARTAYLPYGLIELEPSFPLTNFQPEKIRAGVAAYDRSLTPLGIFANAQNHVLQLPNTYMLAHFAQGGAVETLDVAGFAEELLPGCGALLADAWSAMGGEDTAKMRALSAQLAHCTPGSASGRYAGLLFANPARYLSDLAMQLAFRADMLDFASAGKQESELLAPLRALLSSWSAWQRQTGFADAYYGPVYDLLHPTLRKLADPGINAALDDIDNFRTPEVRHGVVLRLLAAMGAYVGEVANKR